MDIMRLLRGEEMNQQISPDCRNQTMLSTIVSTVSPSWLEQGLKIMIRYNQNSQHIQQKVGENILLRKS